MADSIATHPTLRSALRTRATEPSVTPRRLRSNPKPFVHFDNSPTKPGADMGRAKKFIEPKRANRRQEKRPAVDPISPARGSTSRKRATIKTAAKASTTPRPKNAARESIDVE